MKCGKLCAHHDLTIEDRDGTACVNFNSNSDLSSTTPNRQQQKSECVERKRLGRSLSEVIDGKPAMSSSKPQKRVSFGPTRLAEAAEAESDDAMSEQEDSLFVSDKECTPEAFAASLTISEWTCITRFCWPKPEQKSASSSPWAASSLPTSPWATPPPLTSGPVNPFAASAMKKEESARQDTNFPSNAQQSDAAATQTTTKPSFTFTPFAAAPPITLASTPPAFATSPFSLPATSPVPMPKPAINFGVTAPTTTSSQFNHKPIIESPHTSIPPATIAPPSQQAPASTLPPPKATKPEPRRTPPDEVYDTVARTLILQRHGLLEQCLQHLARPLIEAAKQQADDERLNADADDFRRMHLSLRYGRRWRDVCWRMRLKRRGGSRRAKMREARSRRSGSFGSATASIDDEPEVPAEEPKQNGEHRNDAAELENLRRFRAMVDEASRSRALPLPRGQNTTRTSYFKLKAMGLDPNSAILTQRAEPLFERKRLVGDSEPETTVDVPTKRTKISPKPKNEDDELFAAARAVREAMNDSIAFFREEAAKPIPLLSSRRQSPPRETYRAPTQSSSGLPPAYRSRPSRFLPREMYADMVMQRQAANGSASSKSTNGIEPASGMKSRIRSESDARDESVDGRGDEDSEEDEDMADEEDAEGDGDEDEDEVFEDRRRDNDDDYDYAEDEEDEDDEEEYDDDDVRWSTRRGWQGQFGRRRHRALSRHACDSTCTSSAQATDNDRARLLVSKSVYQHNLSRRNE
ncbi:hypothetical protein MRB53_038697 [Persea americana]|nr:hypothetical protein MRB53_038697 [Persea americana]